MGPRALLAIAALAGCYRPATERDCNVACGANRECPTGLQCNEAGACTVGGGACPSTELDAAMAGDGGVIDGPPHACATFATNYTLLVTGNSYTTADGVAVYWLTADQKVYEERDAGPPAVIVEGQFFPKLAATGTVLYVTDMARDVLYQSQYAPGVGWQAFGAVTVTGLDHFIPGTVSSTIPRLMYVAKDGVLYEGRDTSAMWSFATVPSLAAYQGYDPSIDPTGLRLVFVAVDQTSGQLQIRISTRATTDDAWLPPVLLHDFPGNETFPFLSADCTALYFYDINTGNTYVTSAE